MIVILLNQNKDYKYEKINKIINGDETMIKLRDYQLECVNKILEVENGDCVCCKSPTASGKTIILSEVINRVYKQGSRVLVVVPSGELRLQSIAKIKMVCGEEIDIGSVQANIDQVSNQIVVATRQSLTHSKSDRIDRMRAYGEFDYVIYDECHVAIHQQKIIYDKLNNGITKFIGFSATPYNDEMLKLYTKIIFKRGIFDMIVGGYIVEPRCKLIYSNTDISDVGTVAGEFNLSQLEECINNEDRNELIVNAYNEFAKDRNKTIIFATGIDHAKEICDCFIKNNIKACSLDSTDSKQDREDILQKFHDGEIKVLVNVSILTTGFDETSVDTIILARPTKSRMLFEQIIGRGLRLHEGKKDCLIIDVVDIARKNNIMSLSDVFDMEIKDGETPTEAKERIDKLEEEERLKLEEERRLKEEEERRRQEMIAHEIQMFNSDMKNIVYYSQLDWFRFDDVTYSLLGDMTNSTIIRKTNDNEFTIYIGIKDKFLSLTEDYTTNNLQDAIQYCEEKMIEYGSSYINKNSKWKFDKATEKQLQYINDKIRKYIKTKWDVNKVFFNNSLYRAFKYLKII